MKKKKETQNKKSPPHVDELVHESDIDIELEATEFEGVSQNDKLKDLRTKLKEAQQQSQEYLTGWQKERAHFANYKTEEEKKRQERLSFMKINLLSDFLPVLDSFDMAFKNREAWEKVDSAWRNGVEYIHTQFINVLENYGIEMIDRIDIEFNPQIHEPIEHVVVAEEKHDNKIIELIQKGYRSGDTILRPAKVKVGKYDNTGDTN